MNGRWWDETDPKLLEEGRMKHNLSNVHLLQRRLFLFDQDGTLYLDFKPLPHALEFLSAVKNMGAETVFMSNNSSKSSALYQQKIKEILGIDASQREIYTSTKATIAYLKSVGADKVYMVGTPGFMEELEDAGIRHIQENPQLIVLAFDTTLTYKKLEEMCYHLQDGIGFIATHPDKVCPTTRGYIPDIGAFMALIKDATGAEPQAVLGKPNVNMAHFILKEFNASPDEALIFGDRLYTDMQMGFDSGIGTVLMLTGETKVGDLRGLERVPDLVLKDLGEALELMRG
ncbi:MAG: HAD-IIA family hydrolase [Candidatus Thermoplasmatota archaeon]|nr:HAD-IIA family hydrolase [Candidatus Thermoplasmatota archaeon]